jgi:solute carrier family 10 (sodium/bile acid cotransporter), member 3/5
MSNSTHPATETGDGSLTTDQYLILFVNFIISFACGCATTREAYAAAARLAVAPLICTLAQFLARPALAYAIVTVLDVENAAAVGILLCCSAPGGNGSNLMELLFGGDVELGIVCTAISSKCSRCCRLI